MRESCAAKAFAGRGRVGCLRGKREDIWGDPSRRIRAAWFMEGEQRQLAARGGGWLVGDSARRGCLQGAVAGGVSSERETEGYTGRFVAEDKDGVVYGGRGEGDLPCGAAGGAWEIPHGVGVCGARSWGA